jgi:FkbM family methyltransferase
MRRARRSRQRHRQESEPDIAQDRIPSSFLVSCLTSARGQGRDYQNAGKSAIADLMARLLQASTARLAQAIGFARSLAVYYGQPWHSRAMRSHYAGLIEPGDLAFDIGAHVGNQTRCLAGLGARVIAIEPQPAFAAWLRWLFRGDPRVVVVESAVAAKAGVARLYPSPRTPTVATLSTDWMASVHAARSFAGVRWQAPIEVPVTTLDALIERHGLPRLCKIDVEGFEAEILRGLSRPIPLVLFEYVPAAIDVALDSIDLLTALGPYHFNVTIGERRRFLWRSWQERAAIEDWLRDRRPDERSGDVYARFECSGTS